MKVYQLIRELHPSRAAAAETAEAQRRARARNLTKFVRNHARRPRKGPPSITLFSLDLDHIK